MELVIDEWYEQTDTLTSMGMLRTYRLHNGLLTAGQHQARGTRLFLVDAEVGADVIALGAVTLEQLMQLLHGRQLHHDVARLVNNNSHKSLTHAHTHMLALTIVQAYPLTTERRGLWAYVGVEQHESPVALHVLRHDGRWAGPVATVLC